METLSHRVLNRKTKMVTFRLSFDEYERLRGFCQSKGQRSVSDLARTALQAMVDRGDVPDFQARLSDMELRLHLLSQEVGRLRQGSEQTSFTAMAS